MSGFLETENPMYGYIDEDDFRAVVSRQHDEDQAYVIGREHGRAGVPMDVDEFPDAVAGDRGLENMYSLGYHSAALQRRAQRS